MIVAGIQHDIIWERPAENFSRLAPMIERAAAAGARLVVLTEMYATGFSMKTDRIAEPIDGPSARFLADQARAHDVWVCATVPERAEPSARPFNQLVLAAPGGPTRRYAKIHPFTFGREHEHYAAGEDFLTVEIEGTRCTFFVCYDLRFADEFWALAERTDCYVLPANWPAERREHWMALLRARAIENQAYVVGVNRVGDGARLHYCGDSMIIDPFGEIVAQAADTETIITANVDPDRVRAIRAEYPFLQDRR
ncbi:MAG: carbon-nitrogen family hydrolase [Actinomycetota bacterium]|nr:carbon-nitrogen family hydrolase [Actinomycetota bacterium]